MNFMDEEQRIDKVQRRNFERAEVIFNLLGMNNDEDEKILDSLEFIDKYVLFPIVCWLSDKAECYAGNDEDKINIKNKSAHILRALYLHKAVYLQGEDFQYKE